MSRKFDQEVAARMRQVDRDKLELLKSDPAFHDIILQVEREQDLEEEKKDKVGYYLKQFITQNASMLELKRRVAIAAESDDAVLITGPTGTGKELVANALHGRREGKFIDVNCAGMPSELIESELFGHTRGAFTDAKIEKTGMMEAAENGTIFLDEIGEMPIAVQSKLLRALQEKRVRKVGSTESIEINCRVVAATHTDLELAANEGKFRWDLYWRISVIELVTTPLSARTGDIPLIVKTLDREHRITNIDEFCRGINKLTLNGNVRALQRMVRRFYLFGELPR